MVYELQLRTEGRDLNHHQLLESFAVQLMDDNLLHRQSIVSWF
jgi:hypothetical protein